MRKRTGISAEDSALRRWCRLQDCGAEAADQFEVCYRHAIEIFQDMQSINNAIRRSARDGSDFLDAWTRAKAEVNAEVALVYYIRFGDLIKIGTSTRLADRISTLKMAQPDFELLAAEPGSYQTERARHQQFASCRVDGELFTPTTELMDHIATTRSQHGDPAMLTLAEANSMIRRRALAKMASIA